MKSKRKQQRKNNRISNLPGFIALVVLTTTAIFFSHFNMFQKLDYRLYDFILGLSEEIETNEKIVLLDIDDESLGRIGAWPWTRDIMGNVIYNELRIRGYVVDVGVVESRVMRGR